MTKNIEDKNLELKGTRYVIAGKVDTETIKETAKEFQLRVYAVRDGKVLGTAVPDEKGSFSVEFAYPSKTEVGINVVVGPDIPEKYHQYIVAGDICMETFKHHISALEWEEGDSFHATLETLTIDPHLVEHWLWWMSPFVVRGKVWCEKTGRGISYALVDVFEVDPLPGGGFVQDLIGSTIANDCGNFCITFPWFLVLIPSAKPDLIFRVSQNIDNSVRVIYNEDPSETRWDMVNGSWVNLYVKGDCFTHNEPPVDQPGDCSFLFTRVGLYSVDRICSNGYKESSLLTPAGNEDAPFGSILDLCGWFGESSDVTHYKIQYRKVGGTFKDITDPLSNKYYAGGGVWVTRSMGPFSLGGQPNLYTTPYLLDKAEGTSRTWWFPDLMAQWDTTKADGDGLYTLRILGYKWDETTSTLSLASCVVMDPFYGEINLQIDNTPPESEILFVVHHIASPPHVLPVAPCDIIELADGDALEVRFKARDSNGHLGGYRLNAMYGHNCKVDLPPPGSLDDYSVHILPSQKWHGGIFSTRYETSIYGKANGSCRKWNMPTCAYQLRLGVWKRTTNGYGPIYPWTEDTMHITIKRV